MIGLLLVGVLLALPGSAVALELGLYPCCSAPSMATADTEAIRAALAPAGVRIAYIGDFAALESADLAVLHDSLESTWQRGAVPFVNMTSDNGDRVTRMPLSALAWPQNESDWARTEHIWEWARKINEWAGLGGGRYLYLVPWPEVNGTWTLYHDSPEAYKGALARLHRIFEVTGALKHTRLVYAPNRDRYETLAAYYPGSALIHTVGFSAFNQVGCDGPDESVSEVVLPTLRRLRAIAPGKRIIVAQTATGRTTPEAREAWGQDLVTRLRAENDVVGLLWFNRDDVGCPWSYTAAQWRLVFGALDWRF